MFDRLPTPVRARARRRRARPPEDQVGDPRLREDRRRGRASASSATSRSAATSAPTELAERYHAVIYAYGAPHRPPPRDPRRGPAGSHAATEFVAWYNAHPDFADLEFDLSCERAVVIGNGNVATDVARMLALTREELEVTDTADHAIDALAGASGRARSSCSAAAAPRRRRSPTRRSASSAS